MKVETRVTAPGESEERLPPVRRCVDCGAVPYINREFARWGYSISCDNCYDWSSDIGNWHPVASAVTLEGAIQSWNEDMEERERERE